MKEKDIVCFNKPQNDEEVKAFMVVMEMRGERALVADLQFADWKIRPTSVYPVNDLSLRFEFENNYKCVNCGKPVDEVCSLGCSIALDN